MDIFNEKAEAAADLTYKVLLFVWNTSVEDIARIMSSYNLEKRTGINELITRMEGIRATVIEQKLDIGPINHIINKLNQARVIIANIKGV